MENENAILNEEVVSPQKIEEMDDEAFDAYIQSAKKVGDDNENSGIAEPAEEKNAPYMSFETKEALQEYQDKTIGNRLRELREEASRERQQISDLLELSKERYGVTDDNEAISKLFSELSVKAEATDNYSGFAELRNELEYQRQVDNITADWVRQGEALKGIIPDFDLESAFSDRDFYNAVVNEHQTIAEAYPHLRKRPQRRAISEVGNLTNGVMGQINHDVNSMSEKEFEDYIKKIKNS